MSFDYTTSAADALDILTEYGGPVTRRAYSQGTYDPTTGTTAPATADTTRQGVALPFGTGQTMVRGTLIQGGDVRLLLDASGPVTAGDHFIVAGVEYVVASFAPLAPAGVAVLNDIHLRT